MVRDPMGFCRKEGWLGGSRDRELLVLVFAPLFFFVLLSSAFVFAATAIGEVHSFAGGIEDVREEELRVSIATFGEVGGDHHSNELELCGDTPGDRAFFDEGSADLVDHLALARLLEELAGEVVELVAGDVALLDEGREARSEGGDVVGHDGELEVLEDRSFLCGGPLEDELAHLLEGGVDL